MMAQTNRLYADLAWLWPMWSDPAEYAPFCDFVVKLIQQYTRREVRSLLNMGCGGGKNAFNLKQRFAITGIDLSPRMLENARHLNPECRFIQADMRNFFLPERFDAILIDDAISYMVTEQELQAVFARAHAHLEDGGVMVCLPDDTRETFIQNRARISYASGAAKPEHIDVVFVETDYDPVPEDSVYEAVMVYLIREHGQLRIEHDLHHLGLFSRVTWRQSLLEVGFEVHEDSYVEEEKDYLAFACVRPG